jgi:peptidoglycan hydrolase FlgJ
MATLNPLGITGTSIRATGGIGPTVAATTRQAGAMTNPKARAAAQDFEAVFLNSMFSQMMTNVDGEGPFGGGQAAGIWRSFQVNEFSKSFAQSGGIGLAPDIYRSIMAQQEAKAR